MGLPAGCALRSIGRRRCIAACGGQRTARRSRTFVDELQTWLRLEGAVIVAFVTWAYEQQWPSEGFPVEVSSYANWAGAYSTGDRLLVMSSSIPD